MEFIDIPAALALTPDQWSLLENFILLREEPFEQLPHLCQMEEKNVRRVIPALLKKGLVREVPADRGKKYTITKELTGAISRTASRHTERLDVEIKLLERILYLKDHSFITVTGSREIRNSPLLIPEINRYCTEYLPSLEVNIGSCCNFNCLYCCVGHEKKHARPLKDITDDILYGKKNGIEKISFSGGEPTIHPDLFALIKFSKDLGFRQILIATNGARLSSAGYLESLISCGATGFGISFDACEKELSERLWRSPSYELVREGLERVLHLPDVPLKVWTTVTAQNYRTLPELARYLVRVGKKARHRFFPFLEIVCPEENAWENRHSLVPRFTDVVPFVKEALRICHAAGIPMTYGSFPLCLFKGMEKYCMEIHAMPFRLYRTGSGPVFDRLFLDLIRRVKAPQCRHCCFYRECVGVSRGYAQLYGMNELKPIRKKVPAI